MRQLLDAFWRATAYCLHPRVIVLSFLPLVIAAGGAVLLGYFYWEDALVGVRSTLESWSLVAALLQWLDSVGAGGFRNVLAPLVVVALAVPVLVVVSLLLVALLMTPALVSMVARRRFPALERRRGASAWQSLAWSIGCTLVALLALALSLPLWLLPPLVIPPLIWGWLTCRVLAFDVLAEHASRDERRELMRAHRWPLLGMGVVAGYLGAAPSLVWAASAALLVLAPILVVVSVWLYTLVFAFSSLWFAHYALAALAALRAGREALVQSAAAATAVTLPRIDAAVGESAALPAPPSVPRIAGSGTPLPPL
jgi:hypothetical protein